PINVSNGVIDCINASKAPELLNMEIETIIPTKKGSKENAILTPSIPPSTNNSYTGTLFHVAINKTINIKHAIIHKLINVIKHILLPPYTFIMKVSIN